MHNLGKYAFGALSTVVTAGKQKLSILIFHRVLAEKDWMRPGETTSELFDWQMQLLSRYFNALPLAEALSLLQSGRLPPRSVCVTFDDGYADNATVALPILQRYDIPSTVFVSSGYTAGGMMWNDTILESIRGHAEGELDLRESGLGVYPLSDQSNRRAAAYDIIRKLKYKDPSIRSELVETLASKTGEHAPRLMATKDQLVDMAKAGVEIGAHTVSHPILKSLRPQGAKEEIFEAKKQLEEILSAPVRFFAYPNGRPGVDYDNEHVEFVKAAGYSAAVTTAWGVSDKASDLFQLPRFTPWDRSSLKFLLRMAWNMRNAEASRE
jgi:peptidoglycan/xylan/chitin deacetylase (PgdA/CDA1 family)